MQKARKIFFRFLLAGSLLSNVILVLSLLPIRIGRGIEVVHKGNGAIANATYTEERNWLRADYGAEFIRLTIKSIKGETIRQAEMKLIPRREQDLSILTEHVGSIKWEGDKLKIDLEEQLILELSPE